MGSLIQNHLFFPLAQQGFYALDQDSLETVFDVWNFKQFQGKKILFEEVKDKGLELGQNALLNDLRKASGEFSACYSHTATVI